MASPYQIAGVRASLADLMQKSDLQRQQSQRATSKQMGEMQEKFEDELEQLQKDARDRASKNKKLGKILNIVGLGFGPLGAALTKGLTAGYSLQDQKRGAEMLLDKDMQKRYGNTFLRGGMKDFTRMAEDAQVSSGDVLRGALAGGATGFLTNKLLSGGEANPFQNIQKNINDLGGIQEIFAPQGRFGASGEFLPNPNFMDKFRGVFRGSGDILSSLLDSVKDGKEGSMLSGVENLQSAIMLPMLLQQLIGE